MSTQKEHRSDEEYAALAASMEDGDYTVVKDSTVIRDAASVRRGRPRKSEERTPSRLTSVRFTESTLDVVEELATIQGTTTSDLIRTAVDEFLARRVAL